MRLTIIKADNMVYIDGVSKSVDCSSLPEDFHALQWKDNKGRIEFVENYKPPEEITDLTPYQSLIDEWNRPDPVPEIILEPQEETKMAVE